MSDFWDFASKLHVSRSYNLTANDDSFQDRYYSIGLMTLLNEMGYDAFMNWSCDNIRSVMANIDNNAELVQWVVDNWPLDMTDHQGVWILPANIGFEGSTDLDLHDGANHDCIGNVELSLLIEGDNDENLSAYVGSYGNLDVIGTCQISVTNENDFIDYPNDYKHMDFYPLRSRSQFIWDFNVDKRDNPTTATGTFDFDVVDTVTNLDGLLSFYNFCGGGGPSYSSNFIFPGDSLYDQSYRLKFPQLKTRIPFQNYARAVPNVLIHRKK